MFYNLLIHILNNVYIKVNDFLKHFYFLIVYTSFISQYTWIKILYLGIYITQTKDKRIYLKLNFRNTQLTFTYTLIYNSFKLYYMPSIVFRWNRRRGLGCFH